MYCVIANKPFAWDDFLADAHIQGLTICLFPVTRPTPRLIGTPRRFLRLFSERTEMAEFLRLTLRFTPGRFL